MLGSCSASPWSGHLPVRRDHQRRAVPRPGPGGRDPAVVLPVHPRAAGAGLYELKDAVKESVPVGALVVGTVVSFVVAYASIAWLLRFVAGHKITLFVPYRVALGLVLIVLLATGRHHRDLTRGPACTSGLVARGTGRDVRALIAPGGDGRWTWPSAHLEPPGLPARFAAGE